METQEFKPEAPGFMILKADSMERLLENSGWTPRAFANALDIDMCEAYKLLSGEKVGAYTARSFIRYYGAGFAHNYIDWPAMEMEDPYPGIRKQIIQEESLKKEQEREEKASRHKRRRRKKRR